MRNERSVLAPPGHRGEGRPICARAKVLARVQGDLDAIPSKDVCKSTSSPRQTVSVPSAYDPGPRADDARALMGFENATPGVPLLRTDPPVGGNGRRALSRAQNSGYGVLRSEPAWWTTSVSIAHPDRQRGWNYILRTFTGLNERPCLNQKPHRQRRGSGLRKNQIPGRRRRGGSGRVAWAERARRFMTLLGPYN